MSFKIASINSFFDGVSIEDLRAADWLHIHFKVFTGNHEMLKEYHSKRKGLHPLQAVFEEHQPDVVIINEVVRSNQDHATISYLKENGLMAFELDASREISNEFKRGTLVATRFESKKVEIEVQRFPGGHFSALEIPELNLIVIGVQGTPFNWLIRKYQIRTILSYFDKFCQEGYRVIVAGDFNMGIRYSDLKLPDEIKHFTQNTFPCPTFHDAICSEKSISGEFMRIILKLRKGPRSLDHILYSSNNLNFLEGSSQETVSDHCALVARFAT
jgi:endonuclease/exonuclease/phosphatase family metal-dependent hydrolase